jgi:hypothetical protein
MENYVHRFQVPNARLTNQQLVSGLQSSLDKNYSRIFAAAKAEWERRFSGKDPSDACVSVRVRPAAPARIAHFSYC